MSDVEPNLAQVLQIVRDIVTTAIDADEITELTPRIVRARAEQKLGLQSKVLDGPEYKSAISQVIEEVTNSLEDEHKTSSTNTKKRKSVDKQKGKESTKRAKRSESGHNEQAEHSGEDEKPKRKPRARKPAKQASTEESNDNTGDHKKTKTSKVTKSKKNETQLKGKKSSTGPKGREMDTDSDGENAPSRKRGKVFLSADIVESDVDMDVSAIASTSKVDQPVIKPKSAANESDMEGEPSKQPTQTNPASSKVITEIGNPTSTPVDRNGEGVSADKSGSEMSILNEEFPKRKRKTKGKSAESKPEKKTKEPKQPRSKKTVQGLSKDEETIKRLKSFVVACGVRKVWSKEFKDLDKPSLQIGRLREILSDLGMVGRMSLEQAKSIRAKREFAQELEDVRSFEQSVVGGSRRSRSSKDNSKPASEHDDEEDNEKDSDEDAGLPRKRVNARKSIMAFLGDQSDDE